jgi:hypothetical protein
VAGGPSEAEPGDGCAAAARSAAALVKPPAHTPRERETWSKAEVRKFLAKASLIGSMSRGACPSKVCAAVKCSACAGRISNCERRRSLSIRRGS